VLSVVVFVSSRKIYIVTEPMVLGIATTTADALIKFGLQIQESRRFMEFTKLLVNFFECMSLLPPACHLQAYQNHPVVMSIPDPTYQPTLPTVSSRGDAIRI
jgi:hypothetical protein